MTKLASRAAEFRPSQTLAMRGLVMRLRAEGRDIIPLLGGEPDYFTPENVKRAGMDAIRNNQTKYTSANGTLELRQALSKKFKQDNKLDYAPDQIVVSMGTKPILHAAMLLVTDPGDEVIVPAPFWVSYPDIARIVGATPVSVPGSPDNGFRLRPEALERTITSRSRVLVLNSPNNPTGTIYTMEDLEALAAVLQRHPDVWVVADEIYEHIRFEDGTVPVDRRGIRFCRPRRHRERLFQRLCDDWLANRLRRRPARDHQGDRRRRQPVVRPTQFHFPGRRPRGTDRRPGVPAGKRRRATEAA